MAFDWHNDDWRRGWYQRKKFEKKQRLLWVLLGFMLREIALFVVWALVHMPNG